VYVWVLCLLVCVLVELMFSSQGIATMAKRVSELRLTLLCVCVWGVGVYVWVVCSLCRGHKTPVPVVLYALRRKVALLVHVPPPPFLPSPPKNIGFLEGAHLIAT